jgi:hypothetical protein
MLLGRDRRARIRQRIEPILQEYNPELQFITVFVDSDREYLGVVTQLRERPVILKFSWVDFISVSDEGLREEVLSQLSRRLGQPTTPVPVSAS